MIPSRTLPPAPAAALAALRAAVRAIEQSGRATAGRMVPFGIAEVDDRLAGGGLAASALHEAAAASDAPGDAAAAALFLAALAARFSRESGGQALWALTGPGPFAPGLAGAGLTPDRVFYAACRDDAETLAVMEDGLRHGGLAAVAGEISRADMASVRRLQLAAEENGTTAFLLRRWRRQGGDPLGVPSSAVTRWRIGCAPSAALPYAGVGRARWQVDLVRQRGGPPHQWLLEAPDGEGRLALPAGSRDRADPAGRADRIAA